MKKYILTIDGGTTNTRITLWDKNKKNLAQTKEAIGIRDCAREESNIRLKESIKTMLEKILIQNDLTYHDVKSIYACGMLTSNVGIHEVSHISAPAGIEDYINNIEEVLIPEICPLSISFVPGMKNLSGPITLDNLDMMDIMRGEETETIALMELCTKKDVLYVLPGSHTKFVAVDKEGKMTGCMTSMAGELTAMLTEQSILSDAVGKKFASPNYCKKIFLEGARQTWKTGMSRAAFLTRIANQFISKDEEACASFLLGVVLAEDILAVKHSAALKINRATKIVIAGKEPLRSALFDLFVEEGSFQEIYVFEDEIQRNLSGYGMCVIAERREENKDGC